MKLFLKVVVCCALFGCASTPEAKSPDAAAPDVSTTAAAMPDNGKAIAHLREHVKYPASRTDVLAACANTPEFSAAEKQWLAQNLPEMTYASADEVIAVLRLSPVAAAEPKAADPVGPEPAAYAEMRQMFGMVPGFMKLVPVEFIGPIWMDFKAQWIEETSIPAKYKDLISVAVAAQIPCKYCISTDSKFAIFDGASDQELKEAVLMASLTRKWSTILNGSMQDDAEFRREIDKGLAYVKKMAGAKQAPPVVQVTDASSAVKDIEGTFGMVPTFLKRYPEKGLAGGWMELKSVQFNPHTALPNKYKELIGIAVSAQIPCKYCLYIHREVAKMNGATQVEIDEAVAIASDTRHWSTFFHGLQVDDKAMQQEVDDMLKRMKAQMAKAAQ